MRKVKFTQETFCEKLTWILEDFPKLDDIHPFLADLCNVLYDRDHYKLALGQLNICKNLIATISKDYVRLLKYGDTLYRCKQLKRAALGRMATLMKKHKSSLGYLEEVRKHLSRLPAIDPNTRTLLITGYPNVGKSSFMNKVTRADVEVQPYAFTTKSLFVGHMDHSYLRWQVIDTPGILDKPLEDRNTIEMQAITALAHLQCAVLYFLDLSEQCGWTIEQQIALFDNIRPLFANKPLVVVANKIDVTPLESLSAEHRAMIDKMTQESGALLIPMSAAAEINIAEVKERACEMLLERRVELKTKSKKLGSVLNRLTVAVPEARDKKERPAVIPEGVLERHARKMAAKKAGEDGMEVEEEPKRRTERDLMWENGGPGIYSVDYRKYYKLRNPEHKYDAIPEIIDGKNIADFVDPDIMDKLEALEKEEEEREARELAILEAHENEESDLDEEERDFVTKIRRKKKLLVARHREERGKNRATLFNKHKLQGRTADEFKQGLDDAGFDTTTLDPPTTRGRKRERSVGPEGRTKSLDVNRATKAKEEASRGVSRSASRARSLTRAARSVSRVSRGLSTPAHQLDANKRMKKAQKKLQVFGKAGEADRKHLTAMPKHIFAGKRKGFSHDRR